ncbi:SMP-30/gluconolactonase/LRE family protein [Halopiger djelfimassiliensis]|uniref:SMP-30/gluconolactonase/LRE family protein n=1 Tax=Halopiger djelfimassiliensis TaxID=1293047 RepID=UPI0006780EE5|nr:hypothetical protein [Halopiger djelfimassiliensis]
MSERSTDETASVSITPSRRAVLGTVAGVGTAVTASAVSGATQEHESDDRTEGTDLEVVADFEPPSLPENIAIDENGRIYLSMAITGEIRAIDPGGTEETIAQLDVGEDGLLLGLVVRDGTIHAAMNAGDPETHGVWRVEVTDGAAERVAELPATETEPNGIVPDPYVSGAYLVSDHRSGAIWRVSDGEAEPWVDDPSLDPDPEADPGVGADGLAIHPDGDVYVDNLDYGRIVRVPVETDGTAGEPELIVEDDALVGADGMTFDADGTLYVAVNARDAIARIDIEADAEPETLVEGGVLDFPADVEFGRGEAGETSLYICNFALERFQTDEDPNPSLARLETDASGFVVEPGEFADDGAAEADAEADGDDGDANETEYDVSNR